MSLKNPNLGPGIKLLIGKVPQRGSTPLSPIKVSTDLVVHLQMENDVSQPLTIGCLQ